MPADLGYHSPERQHDWQAQATFKSCEYLDGAPCYYDGSTLNAEPVYRILPEKGDEGVWEYLKAYYRRIFEERGAQ